MVRKQNLKEAFTLIELLVTVFIIGILSSTIAVYLNSAQAKNRDARRKTDLALISDALEKYYSEKKVYPLTQESACANAFFVDFIYTGSPWCMYTKNPYVPSLVSEYLKTLPHDPKYGSTGTDKGYMYRSNGDNYKIWAYNSVETNTPVPITDEYRDLYQPTNPSREKSFQISSPGGINF